MPRQVTAVQLAALEVLEAVDWPFALQHPIGEELLDKAGTLVYKGENSPVSPEEVNDLLMRYATFAEQLERHQASR